ncbi:interleukin-1 receptor type 1-like [Sardina pilchardus]|uniref:interleukin-1 receptor type 1-like n=1 Tax=Sardina pilchardus TaxID=27697 RepID=UPI002E132B96
MGLPGPGLKYVCLPGVCGMAWRWLSVCVGLLLLAEHPKGAKGETEETEEPDTDEEYNTCVDHVIVLPCVGADESDNVTWSRWGAPPLDTAVAGVEVRGGALWFLPADSSHSGIYICNSSGADLWHAKLYVGSGVCPKYNFDDDLKLDYPGRLRCRGQDHIFSYAANLRITWLKDCTPLNKSEKILPFPWVTVRDKGDYTCLLHFSLDGHNYTSASTYRVSIYVPKQLSAPLVVLPINGTRERVKLWSRHELHCNVTTGNTKTLVSWTKDSKIINNNTDFTITEEVLGSRVVTTLIISEVRKEHLNTPFRCWALNAVGQDFSHILLEEANQELFYCVVGLGVSCGLLLVCAFLCWCCRVELVLLYRSLCPLRKPYGFSPRFWRVTMVTNSSSEAEMTSQVKRCMTSSTTLLQRVADFSSWV